MTKRSAERLDALSCILSDGLMYSWFRVKELDDVECTATIRAQFDEDEWKTVKVGPDDIARGLRMYRQYLEGKREMFPGEWKYTIKDLIRSGAISDESEFKPEVHARATPRSYGWQTVKFDQTNGADGDYDANTADNVLQFAIFGQVIYG